MGLNENFLRTPSLPGILTLKMEALTGKDFESYLKSVLQYGNKKDDVTSTIAQHVILAMPLAPELATCQRNSLP